LHSHELNVSCEIVVLNVFLAVKCSLILIVLISSLSFEYRLPPRDDILRLVAVIGQVSNGKGGKIRPFPIHTVRVHILIYERSDSHSRPRYST